MQNVELSDLPAFLAVAEHLSFRAAAAQLGVTPSALSHRMRQLEERVGVRLLNRTTRSVLPTDAGRQLLEQLRPAVEQIFGAMENLRGFRDYPTGRLRIHAPPMVAEMAVVPIWRKFLDRYPTVELEVSGGEEVIDIVAKGYDAGIGPREFVALDMTAVRVTSPIEISVVGSPTYFARHPIPKTPEDLLKHNCIQTRLMNTGTLVNWTLTRKRTTRAIFEKSDHTPVTGNLIVGGLDIGLRAAVDGLGLNYTLTSHSEFLVQSGHLVRVLEDWSPVFEGLYLYYPGNRQIPVALRALIDMLHPTPNKVTQLDSGNPFLGRTAEMARQEVVAKRAHKPAASKVSIKKAK